MSPTTDRSCQAQVVIFPPLDLTFYAQPGPLTWLNDEQTEAVRSLRADPPGLCSAVQGLLTTPESADGADLSDESLAERNARQATVILSRALELDSRDLAAPRPQEKRVVALLGTWRDPWQCAQRPRGPRQAGDAPLG
jgi:hypothetical protein